MARIRNQLKYSEFQAFQAQQEQLIRIGQGRVAGQQILSQFNLRSLRRKRINPLVEALAPPQRAKLLELLRRTGQHAMAIRVGHPYIRGRQAEIQPPDPIELLEYAAALSNFGLEAEAFQIFASVAQNPSASQLSNQQGALYKAYAHMHRWEYRQAIELLELYLTTSEDEYFRRIASLNLAAALIFEKRHKEAEEICQNLLGFAQTNKNNLLAGNSLELLAQLALQQDDLPLAQQYLHQANQQLEDADPRYLLFVKKWLAVIEMRQTKFWPDSAKTVLALARQAGHYETIRDLWYHRGVVLQQAEVLQLLYVGTPNPSFRARLTQAMIQRGIQCPHALRVQMAKGPWHFELPQVLDVLETAQSEAPHYRWQRLLAILKSDLFGPWRPTSLFQQLFANQWFDPHSSMNRLHHAIHQLRRICSEQQLGLSVQWDQTAIYLQAEQPLRLQLQPFDPPPPSYSQAQTQTFDLKLQQQFANRAFSIEQACAALKRPRRTVQRYLRTLVDEGRLQKSGGTKNTRYTFA